MTFIRAALLILVCAAPAFGQLQDMRVPSQSNYEQDRAAYFENERTASRENFWRSKKFWISFGLATVSMFADYEESQQAFARGAHEDDPIFFSSRPSLGRMTAIGLPLEFGASYAGFRMSESRNPVVRKLWWIPAAGQVGEHVTLALRATREGLPTR
jgi:hypothetical protein